MAQQIIRTEVKAYRIDKICEKCEKGRMRPTGNCITTQFYSLWEHKCNGCGHIESYENVSYPYNEYVDIENDNK